MQLLSYIFAGLLVALSFSQGNTKAAPYLTAAPYSSVGNNLKPDADTAEEVVVPGLVDTASDSVLEDAPLRDEVTQAIENILKSTMDKAADAPVFADAPYSNNGNNLKPAVDTAEEVVVPGLVDTAIDSTVDEITEPIENNLKPATDKAADAPAYAAPYSSNGNNLKPDAETAEEVVVPGLEHTAFSFALQDAPLRDEINESLQNAVPYEVAIQAAIKKAQDAIRLVIKRLYEQIYYILKNAYVRNIGNIGNHGV